MAYLSDAPPAEATPASVDRQPRMVISTEGVEGSGKTDFALRNTPRPVSVHDFDYGMEGVGGADAAKLIAGVTRHPYDLTAPIGVSEAQAREAVARTMAQFLIQFRKDVAEGVRTLVVDTFTAAWAGQRVARSDDRYVEYEEEFKALVRSVYASDRTNLILIHHMKADWKRDTGGKSYKAGTVSRDGMDGVLTMVQLGIRQRYVAPQKAGDVLVAPGHFEMDVLKCRDNIGLVGTTLPAMDFVTLCGMVCPAVDWSK